jgi:hypothetical protein
MMPTFKVWMLRQGRKVDATNNTGLFMTPYDVKWKGDEMNWNGAYML